MRLHALMLICCIVAVLSGQALFVTFGARRGGWLDAVFLVSVLVALLLLLGMLVRKASQSFGTRIGSKTDHTHRPHR